MSPSAWTDEQVGLWEGYQAGLHDCYKAFVWMFGPERLTEFIDTVERAYERRQKERDDATA